MSKAKTSPNKVEANRRNAKKSTGPRSAAGKAKSSRNAVKHGLLASRIVLADNPEEDPKQFGLLLDGLRDDYQPQSTIETMLVERLAASFWRLRRAYRFEVETITQANQPNPYQDALNELSPLPPVKRGERILPAPHSLDRLIRYETMIDRELLRTMRQLDQRQRLRKMRQSQDRPDCISHWQQAASGTPAPAPQPLRQQHGHEYLPMPPDQARAGSRRRVAAGASAGRPPVGQRRPTRGSAATGTLLPKSAKAPAPNEATLAPSAGSATRCARLGGSSLYHTSPFTLAASCQLHPGARRSGFAAVTQRRSVPRSCRPCAEQRKHGSQTCRTMHWGFPTPAHTNWGSSAVRPGDRPARPSVVGGRPSVDDCRAPPVG